ncbi:helicase HerA-like domain-containing protein [Robiginitomaculum antarcticum]|uniref:helicase HerA-like domain-containing protein n=1 Tax=Robiginitomaculum antarcticum TaxID=437507 RepID=UPI000374A55B|nr:helicase HerA-like domain-containing protein [Robiginitomaculum antarcticum]
MGKSIFVGKDTDGLDQVLLLNKANRHGLIAGATGTGKTVTLQILTEGFSKAGVPVFCADVKGDLSGLSQPGSVSHKLHDKLLSRAAKIGLDDYRYSAMPVIFWDLYSKQGHPIRATISEMGPTLLARLMDLNPTQEGILTIAFELADDEGMLLLDLQDLRALLNYISDHKKEISREYGNVTSQSVAAIQRSLLTLEREGAEEFFGEPALKLADLMRVNGNGKKRGDGNDGLTLDDLMQTDEAGRGIVSILAADELINSPKLYSVFLLWLLSELFEELPEVGNPDKPKLVFFFDEAHLLFDDAPDALIDKIEQVARLIRSKGVGVFFVTQNPMDIPDSVLGQLGNRIQHALRAYTPKEQKAIRAAASSFRENPNLDTEEVITDLGIGEALVSLLDEKGVPGVVGRTLIRPPASRLGPATKPERKTVIAASPVGGLYDDPINRESAYEILAAKELKAAEAAEKAAQKTEREKAKAEKSRSRSRTTTRHRTTRKKENVVIKEIKREGRLLMRREGRKIIRGILGAIIR